jgi:phosphoserine phosphatase RsbU/P
VGVIPALLLSSDSGRPAGRVQPAARLRAGREKEERRIREEIRDARQLQLGMLPTGSLVFHGVDVSAICLPANEVGGDYYDYFALPGSKLGLAVGDVAGHGLASGVVLYGVRSCLHLLQDELGTPGAVLTRLDRMQRATSPRMLVTLLLLALDPSTGWVTLASAGHPPAIHYSASSSEVHEVGKGAPPLGTRLEPHYEETRVLLAPGDTLVLYTDGLAEAMNHKAEQFGESRLGAAVASACRQESARDVREALLVDLANFKGDVQPADDVTLVVLRWKR